MTRNKYTICVDSVADANIVVDQMRNLIITYGCATVSELKELCGQTPDHIDDDYRGWINLPEVELTKCSDGMVDMDFPMPVPLGPKAKPKEAIDHPDHYQSETGLEAWDVIEAFTFDLKGIEAFDTGNILKYMCRWKSKNGLEDLKKAARYLKHLIDHVEKIEKENDRS